MIQNVEDAALDPITPKFTRKMVNIVNRTQRDKQFQPLISPEPLTSPSANSKTALITLFLSSGFKKGHTGRLTSPPESFSAIGNEPTPSFKSA